MEGLPAPGQEQIDRSPDKARQQRQPEQCDDQPDGPAERVERDRLEYSPDPAHWRQQGRVGGAEQGRQRHDLIAERAQGGDQLGHRFGGVHALAARVM